MVRQVKLDSDLRNERRRREMNKRNSMQGEPAITAKVVGLLEKAGIPRNAIKQDHKMWLGGARPFVADIAIVGENNTEKAVFEIKNGSMSEAVKARIVSTGKLFRSIWPDIPFYAACDGKVSEIKNEASLKWINLEPKFAVSLKKRVISNKHRRNNNTVSWYLKELESAKRELDNQFARNNIIPEEDKRTVKYFFRGQSDFDYQLVPSLFREIMDAPILNMDERTYFKEEQYLIQEAERVMPSAFSYCKTDIDRMTVAQHYEIPTRLLDVTGNALVALYFAAQPNKNNADGAVYVFRASTTDFRMASTAGKSDRIQINAYHDRGHVDLPKEPFLVFPSFRTQRQSAQDGSFYMFGNEVNPVRMHELPEGKCAKVRIPKRRKHDLLAQLEEACNIHKGTLFPESLANYCEKFKVEALRRIKTDALVELTADRNSQTSRRYSNGK